MGSGAPAHGYNQGSGIWPKRRERTTPSRNPIDLDRYFERIGFGGATEPSWENLAAIHRNHVGSIPFENVDPLLGRPVRLDLDSLEAKLVGRRRGGYCFEHNTLLAAVLRALGFDVDTLEARVRPPDATETLPRTHMTLAVTLAGRRWLCDVGFGADGRFVPVPLDGEVSEQVDALFRVERESEELCVLRRLRHTEPRDTNDEDWEHSYAFRLEPALPIDFEVANHYTATHPTSIFIHNLTVQRSASDARRVLRGRTLTERAGDRASEREVTNDELPELITATFGLDLSEKELAKVVEITS